MSNKADAKSSENKPIKLRILDKEVQIACKPGEENDLAKAAAHVDKSMRELRLRNASSSTEKIAIVTAINTANTLLRSQSREKGDGNLATEIANMNAKLEALLVDS